MKKKGTVGVTKVISTLTVQTQLDQILQRVREKQDRFLISKDGEAEAFIFSVEDFLRSIVKQPPKAIRELREIAKKKGLDKLTMEEVDAEIAAHRKGL